MKAIISNLAPIDEDSLAFFLELEKSLNNKGFICFFWSADRNDSFRNYIPMSWDVSKWPNYEVYLNEKQKQLALSLVEKDKWVCRIKKLCKQSSNNIKCLYERIVFNSFYILETYCPKIFFSWNNLCPHTGIMSDICKTYKIKTFLIERGNYPRTWYLDQGGLIGHLSMVSLDIQIIKQEYENYIQGKKYIENLSINSNGKYKQSFDKKELNRFLELKHRTEKSNKKIILLLPPDDLTIGFFPEYHEDRIASLPGYYNSFDVARKVALNCDDYVVFKPHPSFVEYCLQSDLENLHIINYDFLYLIEHSDIIVHTGSGLSLIALSRGKPVLNACRDMLYNKGITYDMLFADDIKRSLEKAKNLAGFHEKFENFFFFTGYIMRKYMISLEESGLNSSKKFVNENVEDTSRNELKEILTTKNFSKLIYDFDNTLLLDNSTNLYFNSLRPKILVYIIFGLVDFFLRKLRVKNDVWGDFIKVIFGVMCFPWSYIHWYFIKSKRVARLFNNNLLDKHAISNEKIFIVSFGFDVIIKPLLNKIDIKYTLISCKPFLMCNIRTKGKLHYLKKYLGKDDREKALFVSDSIDDNELLCYFKKSFLIKWNKMQTILRFDNVYVPFRYTMECKYPIRDILWNQHIGEDFIILLLAYSVYNPIHICCLFMLFVSFFCIYEIGYYENDFKASKKESAPTLSGKQKYFEKYPIYTGAILTSATISVFPIYYFSDNFLLYYIVWIGVLFGVYSVFKLFNNVDTQYRIYVFPVLQFFKTCSYAVVLKLNILGMVLLFSQAMRQVTNYNVYRHGGNTRIFKRQNHRMLIFFLLLCFCLVSQIISFADIITIQFFCILSWIVQRSVTRDFGDYKKYFRKIFKKSISFWRFKK